MVSDNWRPDGTWIGYAVTKCVVYRYLLFLPFNSHNPSMNVPPSDAETVIVPGRAHRFIVLGHLCYFLSQNYSRAYVPVG
jgi:hypothetical protein